MLALCSMLSVTYYAQNYAGIIGWSLTIRLWNTLPEDIIYSNSLRQFRTSLNFYLTNQSNLPIIS